MMKIRLATTDDAAALLKIYRPYILQTTITFEESVPTLMEFKKRIADVLETFPYLVAVNEANQICGYAYAHPYNLRAAYAWTAETSVYVDAKYKRHGLGTQLYQKLEELLTKQGVVNLLACVTEENTQSIKFHEKVGYQTVGTFLKAGYKFDRWLNITWLQKRLSQTTDNLTKIIPVNKLNENI